MYMLASFDRQNRQAGWGGVQSKSSGQIASLLTSNSASGIGSY